MSFDVGWYPVALSNGLEPGRSTGTRLFDQELCIWRDVGGDSHAWEDRCPHRGMRLSFGFVRGDRIVCLYHGWNYDSHGQCRLIPAHPDLEVPATIRVATYQCVEQLGMLWVYSNREVAAPPPPPIDVDEVVPVRSLYVDCEPGIVMQTLSARSKNLASNSMTLLSLDADGHNSLIGVQPYGKAKTALHIVLVGPLKTRHAAAQHAVAAWSEEFRRVLEEGASSKITTPEAAP
jgi:nitrite reductase/ring-hydroxylating ferredoxin subunit